ncbi:2-phospho-L-lactate guanylyltransferase [Geoglobus acetivorans]|uniref:2-phospho-L-lactate guanylyltransferase n=1 Tax=Geoglobus acetivorans TaxID=565033 RepID=A0ABZ3H5S9_GEOAI|nr:2-phospho-L-lactate guanylyltransferase [Geoglobus acetivorans]
MKIYVPFKPENPKSRLSGVLSPDERKKLAYFMLLDVIDACGDCTVVSSSSSKLLEGIKHEIDNRSLDEAVTSRIKQNDAAIIMSDLALLTEKTVERFIEMDGDVVLAPGRKGGTNMLLSRSRQFYTSYHYGSFFKHVDICRKLKLECRIFDSFFASVDIDEEDDLLELVLHGRGKRSYEYLEDLGFYVDLSGKDPKLVRE